MRRPRRKEGLTPRGRSIRPPAGAPSPPIRHPYQQQGVQGGGEDRASDEREPDRPPGQLPRDGGQRDEPGHRDAHRGARAHHRKHARSQPFPHGLPRQIVVGRPAKTGCHPRHAHPCRERDPVWGEGHQEHPDDGRTPAGGDEHPRPETAHEQHRGHQRQQKPALQPAPDGAGSRRRDPKFPPEIRDEETVARARRPVGNGGGSETRQPQSHRALHAKPARKITRSSMQTRAGQHSPAIPAKAGTHGAQQRGANERWPRPSPKPAATGVDAFRTFSPTSHTFLSSQYTSFCYLFTIIPVTSYL